MNDALGDRSTDKTVENAEEMGGGYGGPFPADPAVEGTSDDAAPADAGVSDSSAETDATDAPAPGA